MEMGQESKFFNINSFLLHNNTSCKILLHPLLSLDFVASPVGESITIVAVGETEGFRVYENDKYE